MSRYIDADKLVQDLNEFYANVDCRWQRGRDTGLGINIAKQIIENQPTADVQEVKRHNMEECSKCGCCSVTVSDMDNCYCPHCGAKMDKGK